MLIFNHVDWAQSCLSMWFTLWREGCGLHRCAELRRSWCGAPRCRVSEYTVRSMVSKYACASHMRRGHLRMALRLLPWVAGRSFETFVAAHGESERKSLAGRLIQVLCCQGVGLSWVGFSDRCCWSAGVALGCAGRSWDVEPYELSAACLWWRCRDFRGWVVKWAVKR